MTSSQVEAKYGPVVAVVNSRSEPSKTYNVRRKDGVLSCNCKGWIFNRENPRRCKHTDAVQNECTEKQIVFDLATTLAEMLLGSSELVASYSGKIKKMADILRPYLGKVPVTTPSTDAGLLVGTGVGRIVLDE